MSQTHAARRAAGPAQAERLVRLRMSSFGVVVMLIIQFILGIIYNLYGTAPTSTKSIGLFSSPVIALHVIVGILLLLAGIAQLVRAIGTRHQPAIWLSSARSSRDSGSPTAAPLARPWAWPSPSLPRWPATSSSSSSCPPRSLGALDHLPLRDVVRTRDRLVAAWHSDVMTGRAASGFLARIARASVMPRAVRRAP